VGFEFKFNERTDMLPVLDGYLATEFAKTFSTALEIGVYKGGWLLTLASNNSKIQMIGIDPYPNLKTIKESFIEYRDQIGLKNRLHLYPSFSDLLTSEHNSITYDIIHLDGEHSQTQVTKDLTNLYPLLKQSGMLVIDDIFYHSYPGVTAAAFRFIDENKFTPFLFTEKKIYICNRNFYREYYEKSKSILNELKINYEESENLNSKTSYAQSNSIFGSNIIITSEKPTRKEIVNMLKIMNLKLPFVRNIKIIFANLLPPAFLATIRFSRTKLKTFQSNLKN
jgi:hypothetical protein